MNYKQSAFATRWLGALLALTSCAVEGEQLDLVADAGTEPSKSVPVAVTTEPLFGGTDIANNTCSSAQRVVLRHANMIGRSIAKGAAFGQCVQNTMLNGSGPLTAQLQSAGPYKPCQVDPHRTASAQTRVDRALQVARGANVTSITCAQTQNDAAGETTSSNFDGFDHTGQERFTVDSDVLDEAHDKIFTTVGERTWSQRFGTFVIDFNTLLAIDTIWHEAMHTHNYMHDGSAFDCTNQAINESVPVIIGACMAEVWKRSMQHCSPTACAGSGPGIPIVTGFDATTCSCVRDAVVGFDPGLDEAGTAPAFDENEVLDVFGTSVATGDFDADGFDDLAVGAIGEDSNRGAVYTYRGTVFGLFPWREVLAVNTSLRAGDQFGGALAAADFNSDGFDDLAIGMPQTGVGPGAVFMYLGSARGLITGARYGQNPIGSDEDGDEFGRALAAGDFDGDGTDDLAIGAPGEEPGSAPRSGYVYVMRGTASATGLTMWAGARQSAIDDEEDGDRFGEALAAGQLGSTFGFPAPQDKLVVGAPGDRGVGRIFVFNTRLAAGATSWTPVIDTRPTGLPSGARFGAALSLGRYRAILSGALAVGAPNFGTSNLSNTGQVYIYDQAGVVQQTFTTNRPGTQMGGSLTTAELSDSGFQDVIAGATGTTIANDVTILSGGSSMWPRPPLSQSGLGANELGDTFGYATASGDIDGDGLQDVIVSAPLETPSNEPTASGMVFTWRNLANNAGDPNWTFQPLSVFDQED